MAVTFIGRSPVITGGVHGNNSYGPIENSYAWCSNLINGPFPKNSVIQTQIKNCEMMYPPLSQEVKDFTHNALLILLVGAAIVVLIGILGVIFEKEKDK